MKQIKIDGVITVAKLENGNKLQLVKEDGLYNLTLYNYLGKQTCLQYLKTDVKRLSTINRCLKEKGYGIEFME